MGKTWNSVSLMTQAWLTLLKPRNSPVKVVNVRLSTLPTLRNLKVKHQQSMPQDMLTQDYCRQMILRNLAVAAPMVPFHKRVNTSFLPLVLITAVLLTRPSRRRWRTKDLPWPPEHAFRRRYWCRHVRGLRYWAFNSRTNIMHFHRMLLMVILRYWKLKEDKVVITASADRDGVGDEMLVCYSHGSKRSVHHFDQWSRDIAGVRYAAPQQLLVQFCCCVDPNPQEFKGEVCIWAKKKVTSFFRFTLRYWIDSVMFGERVSSLPNDSFTPRKISSFKPRRWVRQPVPVRTEIDDCSQLIDWRRLKSSVF